MKQLIDIMSGILILLVFQVFSDISLSALSGDHSRFTKVECTRVIPMNLWIDNPTDDTPGEIKNNFLKVFIGDGSDGSFINDLAFKPAEQYLLNPLYLDRPPPVVSL